jgi:tRNA pseudouridine38-40 synthase
MKILLTAAYDGTNYSGWQRQLNAASIQQTLEERGLFTVFGRRVETVGASRTDAGVHALCQKVCFEIAEEFMLIPLEKLPFVINSHLPADIVVTGAVLADESFHPIFSAKKKTYEYAIHNSVFANPKTINYREHIAYPLDFERMRVAAAFFVGEHDFAAFRAAGGGAKTTVRTIYALELSKNGDEIIITITGNGFLYNMVRIIAGTLIDAGRGKIAPESLGGVILSKDRTRAGRTASAKGLTLTDISY